MAKKPHNRSIDRRRSGRRNSGDRHLTSVSNAAFVKPAQKILWLARIVRDDASEPDYFALMDESDRFTKRRTLYFRTHEFTCFDQVVSFEKHDEYTFTAKLTESSICRVIAAQTDNPFYEQLLYGLNGEPVVSAELCDPSEYDIRIDGRSLKVKPKMVKVTVDTERKTGHIGPLYDALVFLQACGDPTSDEALGVARSACDSIRLSRLINVLDGDETYEVPLWYVRDLNRWAEHYDDMVKNGWFDDEEAEWMYRDYCRFTERLVDLINVQISCREESWTEPLSS